MQLCFVKHSKDNRVGCADGHINLTFSVRDHQNLTSKDDPRTQRITELKPQQTQHICMTFIQRRFNVFDIGSTLYKVIRMFCVYWDGRRPIT